LGNCPGIKVTSCIDPIDAKGLLKAAIRDNNPICMMESEQLYAMELEITDDGKRIYSFAGKKYETEGAIPEEGEDYLVEIGKAAIRRTGTDVTIVSFNKMMLVALEAADLLKAEGISAEVIDLRSIRPLDHGMILESVKKTNRLVVVDESWPMYGVSAEIAYEIQKYGFDYLDAPIVRVNSADTNLPYSGVFVEAYLPNAAKVVKAVKEVMYVVS
jgi:pyruvate dehydrogenase E1 component beta subunit